MTWTAPTRDPVDGPLIGADRPILEGFLAWQRATLFIICAGPGGEQLAARPLASSNLSLLVLVRHLAEVERIWFRRRAAGESVEPMYDPERGKDSDFNGVAAADVEADFRRLQGEWRRADTAVAGMDSDHTSAARPTRRGWSTST